jgi:hypothetical protein
MDMYSVFQYSPFAKSNIFALGFYMMYLPYHFPHHGINLRILNEKETDQGLPHPWIRTHHH